MTYSNPSKTNKQIIILTLLSLSIIGALFTESIEGLGKLSISNIIQLLSTTTLMFVNPRFTRTLVKTILFVVICSVVSHIYVAIEYGFHGKIFVTLHIITGLIFFFLMADGLQRYSSQAALKKCILVSILISIAILGLSAALDFKNGLPRTSFTFDDKSHASIYICFLSFLSLHYLGSSRYLISSLLIILCFFSVSRLVAVFIPFLLAIAVMQIVNEGSILKKALLILTLLTSTIIGANYIYKNSEKIQLLERIDSTSTVSSSDSTSAHVLLLQYAAILKFDSIPNFLFGVSPGSFADILIRSNIDYSDLASIDPAFIDNARNSTAPIHSTHAAVLVEAPFPALIVYIAIIISITAKNIRRKNYELLLFGAPFFISVMFYSAHNKFYFFVILLFILLLSNEKNSLAIKGTSR